MQLYNRTELVFVFLIAHNFFMSGFEPGYWAVGSVLRFRLQVGSLSAECNNCYIHSLLLIFPFHLLLSPVRPAALSFYIFPGFLAIFVLLPSSNNSGVNVAIISDEFPRCVSWIFFYRKPERLTPLGIMGVQLNGTLTLLGTIFPWCSNGFRGPSVWPHDDERRYKPRGD